MGAGTYDFEKTIRKTVDLIPKGVTWIQDFCLSIQAEEKTVSLKSGDVVSFDILVVATGLTYDLDGIEGLREGLEKGVVCSNYIDPNKTWEFMLPHLYWTKMMKGIQV